jgi:hypothetical protein
MIHVKTGDFEFRIKHLKKAVLPAWRRLCVWMKLLIEVRDAVGSSNKITRR